MRRRTSVAVRLAVAGGLVVLGVWPSPGRAQAPEETRSIEVDSLAEAWYAKPELVDGQPELPDPSAICESPGPLPIPLPIPCSEAPAPLPEVPSVGAALYPVGTLHVEATAGRRTATAFIVPDLTLLPDGADLLGGVLLLPLNEEPNSGNRSIETARFVACLTTSEVTDGDRGRLSGAPEVDCEAATAKARLREEDNAFAVDLGPFIQQWKAGAPNYGVALLPADDLGPLAVWHVSVNGSDVERGRGAGSLLTYAPAASETPEVPEEPVDTQPGGGTGPIGGPPLGGPIVTPEPPRAVEEPPTAEEPAPTVAENAPLAAAPYSLLNNPWYTYRGVVFLPLAFLVALSLTGRSLTRPLAGVGRR